MDHTESDASGISLSNRLDNVSSQYASSYLKSFLPVYQMVNQSESIYSVADRYKAIKFAADASLAFTASGSTWSDALSKKLVGDCAVGSTPGDLRCEDRISSSLGTASSKASTSVEKQTPEFRANFCEPTAPTEEARWRRKLVRGALEPRSALAEKRNFALRLVCRSGRNWCRSRASSRSGSRLAMVTKLAMRSATRRCSFKRSWKPRAILRKARSLTHTRNRVLPCVKPVERLEPQQTFDRGIAALQRLVPGGSSMDASVLLDEAADFVMFLKLQVTALQSVANAVCLPEIMCQDFPGV